MKKEKEKSEEQKQEEIEEKLDELRGVGRLFLGLQTEPMGESSEALGLTMGTHREVELGGVLFSVDLCIERVLKR